MKIKLTQDTKEKIGFYIKVLTECFKVFMACLLAVFVPQLCENQDTQETHVCTISENFTDLSSYNKAALAFNFITLGVFIYMYYVDTRNETWLINSFDQDRSKPDNYLKQELETNTNLKTQLEFNTRFVWYVYVVATIFFVVNLAMSAVLVLYFYYYDIKTVTALVTNVLLLTDKLINGITISDRAQKEQQALSLYAKEPVLYNIIDKDSEKSRC